MNLFESTFTKHLIFLFEIKDTPNNINLFKKKYNFDDETKIKNIFQRFNQVVNNLPIKDIFKYNSLEDLNSAINIKSKSEKEKEIKVSGSDKVFENENFVILNITNQEASCKYGSGTKWCISATSSNNHWDSYYNKGKVTFYFVFDKTLNKENPKYKVAIAVYPENSAYEIYDANDNSLNVDEYFKYLQENGINIDLFKARKIVYTIEEFINGTYKLNSDGSYDVEGDVNLSNKKITKFPYKFNVVTGYFDCSINQLTSLQGCPRSVGGDFYCNNNQLTSLQGCPQKIGGHFYCNDNQLVSLQGCPQSVGGDFDCFKNKTEFTEKDVKSVCKVGRKIYV